MVDKGLISPYDILKQSFPVHYCRDQDTGGFNPIHYSIAVNESLSDALITDLRDDTTDRRKLADAV
jgi:hypothetical protein